MKMPRKSAFSLIELVIVIAVIAVIAGIILPNISGTNDAAKRQRAVAAAEALNAAQVTYRIKNGTTGWNGASDTDRYLALYNYMTYAAGSLGDFQNSIDASGKYTFQFQNFSSSGYPQKVILLVNNTPENY